MPLQRGQIRSPDHELWKFALHLRQLRSFGPSLSASLSAEFDFENLAILSVLVAGARARTAKAKDRSRPVAMRPADIQGSGLLKSQAHPARMAIVIVAIGRRFPQAPKAAASAC